MQPGKTRGAGEGGFTYLVVLFALAVVGIGLAALGQSWSATAHRDKEEELVQIGQAYVRAIGQYYESSPGSTKTYPSSLADLIEDKRSIVIARHLRKAYGDPMSKGAPLRLVLAREGGIMGVSSISRDLTLQRQGVLIDGSRLASGARYSDWLFIYEARRSIDPVSRGGP